jgi:hypothetical protein
MTSGPIQFGFQNWSTEYDWWVPNTVPKDFIVDGVKRLPATHHTQWFDTGVLQSCDSLEAFNCPVVRHDFLHNYNGPGSTVVYSYLEHLTGQKYIFPILIRSAMYFFENKEIGFDSISPRVFEDVRAGRCRIVLLFPMEGNSGDEHFEQDFAILDNWCTRYNLTREQVYYVHANHRGVELSAGMNFTYIPVDTFICWVPRTFDHISKYEPLNEKDLFLCYNRQPRRHRIILMCEMLQANLLGRGLVSYHGNRIKDSVDQIKRLDRLDLLAEAQTLDNLLPMEIDMDLGANNPAENIVEEHYRNTFLSVVPETLFNDNTLFFSEKIWKTIAVGHPFMIVSSRGMLSKLREQGYKTYNTWWDEGYDEITNINNRIRHIVNELKRLSSLSREELINMRLSMQPTIEYNQQLFNSRYKERCVHREYQLHGIVEGIWNSF